jgi:hypothetical protein
MQHRLGAGSVHVAARHGEHHGSSLFGGAAAALPLAAGAQLTTHVGDEAFAL